MSHSQEEHPNSEAIITTTSDNEHDEATEPRPPSCPVYARQLFYLFHKLKTLGVHIKHLPFSPQLHFINPQRTWVHQTIYTSPHGFRPQRLHEGITFDDPSHVGVNGQGIHVGDVLARSGEGLKRLMKSPEDVVFGSWVPRIVFFVIEWPGYERVPWRAEIHTKLYGFPLTRMLLARQLAFVIRQYTKKVDGLESTDPDWNINNTQKSGISFNQIVLISFVHIIDNVWQASLAVDIDDH